MTPEERARLRGKAEHFRNYTVRIADAGTVLALLDERDALAAEVERLREIERRRQERIDLLTGKRMVDE